MVQVKAGRARKRHVQQELFRHGGKRAGAGRPAKGPRPSERHERRPALRASQPVHVVLRTVAGFGSLRRRHAYQAIREATIAAAKHEGFRIVHVSIQGTHLHLIVEASDRMTLARGVQGFEISAAKHLNRMTSTASGGRRKGKVFADRYHATILATPRQVRNTLAYVLNNWRRHREDRRGVAAAWQMDPFSSGAVFDGWKEREHHPFVPPLPPTYRALIVWCPKSWLLTTGWRRHGLISQWEVPKGNPALPRRR